MDNDLIPPAENTEVKKSLLEKYKSLSKRQKILMLISGIILTGLIVLFLIPNKVSEMIQKSEPSSNRTIEMKSVDENVIAEVSDLPLYKSYLDIELKYHPATPTAELKKLLAEKIIEDQITLEGGRKAGIIKEYPAGENLSTEEYLERTGLVQKIRDKINETGNVVKGKMVMLCFYNNTHIGPKGFEASKKIAFDKIKPLYDQVAKGELTIEQAGLIIRNDKSLKEIDPIWEANALAPFVYYEGGSATHWPEFNKLLFETEPGKLTPLHLGGGILRDGKPSDELYIFAQVNQKSSGSSYNDFSDWLNQQRKMYNSNFKFETDTSFLFDFFVKEAYANSQPNGGQSGAFNGKVRTQTGAPIQGAHVHIWNGAADRNLYTDGNGHFDTGTAYDLSCLNNPQHIKVTYDGQVCGDRTMDMENGSASINIDFVCPPRPTPTPVPTPTPPPVLRCNQPCTEDTYCAQTTGDNCSKCLPSGSGKTCQPPPPPVQCNAVCTDDSFCATNVTGCKNCLPNPNNPSQRTCQPPPACGNLCITPADCNGAQQGCTLCLPDQANPSRNICQKKPTCGTACSTADYCLNADNNCTNCIQGASGAVCGSCPIGQIYDAATKSCKCPNPGETMPHGICDGDKCTQVNTCGITSCTDDKQCFAEEMCKCDGFEATQLEYPSSKPFVFNAFAKIEGTDIAKAIVEGIQFKMSESDKTNPNAGSIIAQSPVYTPEIFSQDAQKLRYKATWSLTPPVVKANKMYRVFAEIKCKPKNARRLSDASNPKQYQSRVLGVSTAHAAENTGGVARDDLQLRTLNFIKKGQTDSCRFLFFEYDQGL